MIVYPTISTNEGAKLAFYMPISLNVSEFAKNGNGNYSGGALAGFMVPNGAKAYQTLAVTRVNATSITYDCAGTTKLLNGTVTSATCAITNTGFTYNVSLGNPDMLTIKLATVAGTSDLTIPALMIFEGKDQNNKYNGMIVETQSGSGSGAGAGVSDVERTWTNDAVGDSISKASDSKTLQEMDLWGSLITTDTSTNQYKATISYPKEQVYALAYIGAADSSIGVVGGGPGGQLGDILVKDTEISSVQTKNLVVVGGSCINSVAAKLVGTAACGPDFTTADRKSVV